MARAIDADKIEYYDDEQGFEIAYKVDIDAQPTLTPPNEQMLERVAREYLEICGGDCVGDPSVGMPECPFFQYAGRTGQRGFNSAEMRTCSLPPPAGGRDMSEHERTIGSVLEEMKREKERQARASELSNCLLEMLDVIADDYSA